MLVLRLSCRLVHLPSNKIRQYASKLGENQKLVNWSPILFICVIVAASIWQFIEHLLSFFNTKDLGQPGDRGPKDIMNKTISITAVSFILTAALGGCSGDNESFRAQTLAKVSALGETYAELIRAHEANEIKFAIYRAADTVGDERFSDHVRQNLLDAATRKCRLEIQVRDEFARIEKKVRDNVGGVHPLWLVQDRNWQLADTHIRQSKFNAQKDGC